MRVLTSKEAEELLQSSPNGKTPPFRVDGKIDLKGSKLTSLPDGISCYELDLSNSSIQKLPKDLHVTSRIILDECHQLESLPENLTTGSISLRFCPLIQSLPEGLSTWFLDLTGCSRFSTWPEQANIERGSLILRNCIGLQYLPDWLRVLGHLDIAGCVQIQKLPPSLKVSSWIDVGGSGIAELPANLSEVPLRWRNVPITKRIAFSPDELTAKEALDEKNAEIRRVIIERMGYLRFAKEAGAKVLDADKDPGGERQLLRMDLQEDEPLVGLACFCPSTGRQYLLRVPPKITSCHAAAAWIAGYDDPAHYRPLIET